MYNYCGLFIKTRLLEKKINISYITSDLNNQIKKGL